jgi:DNA-binding LacI/PurR family transcriptional regulator/AraC-like DNA-binding protein
MMDSGEQQRRIGLLAASMHTGSSLSLWQEVAKQASQSDCSLFVFVGGRLECPEGQEYLRNAIYPLANRQNIDAVISWASALGGYVSADEVLSFLSTLDVMPMVTIGMKKSGYPSVSFDAYAGIQSLILHCIRVHSAKRIAFIRGPVSHFSAQDRWHAYCDALEQGGIAQDSRLISDPMAWTEGAKAVDQLVVERSLVPGVDFDTLVCSSDMMMFDASKRLEALGYTIAEDLRIVGYNDSRESRLLRLPATTSRMPVKELAQVSFSLLVALMDGTGPTNLDVMLPSQPIIRRSCGCRYSLGSVDQARKAIGEMDRYISWLIQALGLDEWEAEALRTILTSASVDEQRSLSVIEELAYRYLDRDGDSDLLSEALFFYCEFFATPSFREASAHAIGEIFLRQRDLVAHEHAYELSTQAQHLDDLKGELLSLRSIDAIPALLQRHLVALGIEQGYLVLTDSESSTFIGGYDGPERFGEQVAFAKALLLPQELGQALRRSVYVVEPLFMENQPLGYLVLGTTSYSGSLMEEIRSAVSSAIKGALLLDAANRAAEEAERAQVKRAEFFANIGEGLKRPLERIHVLLDEQELAKEQVHRELATASHLLELSLSFTGELEFEKVVCDLSSLVGTPTLPVVMADPKRIAQVFEIVTSYIKENGEGVQISAHAAASGLEISCASTRGSWRAELGAQDPGLLLAQRIIIQSGGTARFVDNQVCFTLPWPTLLGEGTGEAAAPIFYLGDTSEVAVPAKFASFDGVALVHPLAMTDVQLEKLSEAVLAWDGERDSAELTLLLHRMSRHSQLAHTPMICIGCPVGDQSLFYALTTAKRTVGEDQLLVMVGDVEATIAEQLGMGEESIRATGEEALALVAQKPVSLVISAEADPSLIQEIRKVSRVPIVIIKRRWTRDEVEEVGTVANLIIAHPHMGQSRPFLVRLARLAAGQGALPPLTGILAKRTVAYFDANAAKHISRWQVAEAAHVSEDYLSRIFHKEMGLSPWEYLSRHRIALAVELLLQGSLSINEVASRVGFSDQAYFCRVFRKIKGVSPSQIRAAR